MRVESLPLSLQEYFAKKSTRADSTQEVKSSLSPL
jgi:hypothetical protein